MHANLQYFCTWLLQHCMALFRHVTILWETCYTNARSAWLQLFASVLFVYIIASSFTPSLTLCLLCLTMCIYFANTSVWQFTFRYLDCLEYCKLEMVALWYGGSYVYVHASICMRYSHHAYRLCNAIYWCVLRKKWNINMRRAHNLSQTYTHTPTQ